MKFIKISVIDDELFISRIKNMSHYAYLNYLDEEKNKFVSDKFLINQPEGFIYFKKCDGFFEVVSSFIKNIQSEFVSQLYEFIEMYYNHNIPLPMILNLNGYNSNAISFFKEKGFVHRYSANEYIYSSQKPFLYENENLNFLPYQQEHSNLYINLLGKAFEKMRFDLNLKPYNWYEANKEEACKYFIEQNNLNSIQGLWVDKELIGVTILDNNNIEMLAVKTGKQGKGYGEVMLKHLMNRLLNIEGYDIIKIAVMSVNTRAINLYTKLGFKEKSKVTYLHKNL